jgi:hypothetical protein
VGRYHRHTPEGDVEALEYVGLPDLIEQFQNEVNQLYDRRTN